MRCSPSTSGSARGPGNCARPGSRAAWTSCAPAPSSTWCSAKTPGPAAPRPPAPRTPPGRTAARSSSLPARARRGAAGGGFAGQVTLTVPLGTAAGRADRPGELAGHGPVDPWLARDLAAAAARNPKTTWCVTLTDQHGHAVGHGCARPGPSEPPETTPDPARRRAAPGSASPPPAGTARRVDTAPGGCAPRDPGRTGSWRSTPWTPGTASTGTRAGVMIRESGYGTCPRSGTPPAPAPSAGGPPPSATSSTTPRTRQAARTCLCNGGPPCKR